MYLCLYITAVIWKRKIPGTSERQLRGRTSQYFLPQVDGIVQVPQFCHSRFQFGLDMIPITTIFCLCVFLTINHNNS